MTTLLWVLAWCFIGVLGRISYVWFRRRQARRDEAELIRLKWRNQVLDRKISKVQEELKVLSREENRLRWERLKLLRGEVGGYPDLPDLRPRVVVGAGVGARLGKEKKD